MPSFGIYTLLTSCDTRAVPKLDDKTKKAQNIGEYCLYFPIQYPFGLEGTYSWRGNDGRTKPHILLWLLLGRSTHKNRISGINRVSEIYSNQISAIYTDSIRSCNKKSYMWNTPSIGDI